MFCSKCGNQIDDEAVVCVQCGCQTKNYNPKTNDQQPIIINNSSSSSASASAAASAAVGGKVRKKHSLLFDIFMIFMTCGLWLIWMLIRPKYY